MGLGIPKCPHPWVFSPEVVLSRGRPPSHLLPGGHWQVWWREGVEKFPQKVLSLGIYFPLVHVLPSTLT